MLALTADAPQTVRDYYEAILAGTERYGDGAALATVLHPDLDFEGPLAGRRVGAAGFLRGVAGFVGVVRGVDVIAQAHADGTSAILYDAHLPGGAVRFSEFFEIAADGLVRSLRIHYDGGDYVAKGGR